MTSPGGQRCKRCPTQHQVLADGGASLFRRGPAQVPIIVISMPDATLHFEDSELTGTLDRYRAVVEHKLAGLDRDAATRVVTASGTTIMGIVKHLTWVERMWFEFHLLERDLELGTNDASLHVEANHTIEGVLAGYRTACETSRHAGRLHILRELTDGATGD